MKRTEFNIEISAENVLESLGVTRQSELYEEMQEELSELLPGAYEKIKPVALLEFGNLKEHSVMRNGRRMTEVLYGLCSIGHEMSSWSTQLFAAGDYVKGMLVDAIADDYLFQMDRKLEGTVIELCKNKKKGIAGRIEAPKDIPMSIQKEAFLAVHAEKEGISIKESYMYDPVKTLCLIYLVDEKETRFSPGHDCAHCENLACKKRRGKQVSVTVCTENEERIIQAKQSETLLSALWQSEIFLPAICAGRGTCGKCKVRVEVGAEEPSGEERKYFSQKELDAGWRLACCMRVTKDTRIILKTEEEEMYVVADGQSDADSKGAENGRYGIAVDIGTTTIAMAADRTGNPTDHRYLYGNQPAENIRCRCDQQDRCFESWEKRSTEADDPKKSGRRNPGTDQTGKCSGGTGYHCRKYNDGTSSDGIFL